MADAGLAEKDGRKAGNLKDCLPEGSTGAAGRDTEASSDRR